ncbi:hypothetical protein GQ53DRAFT_768271 [Thozetella sp. PMI_491]|nr:hypothetical protein GQ53DRAFT_768271 [Thozetella sp. PMI_491]
MPSNQSPESPTNTIAETQPRLAKGLKMKKAYCIPGGWYDDEVMAKMYAEVATEPKGEQPYRDVPEYLWQSLKSPRYQNFAPRGETGGESNGSSYGPGAEETREEEVAGDAEVGTRVSEGTENPEPQSNDHFEFQKWMVSARTLEDGYAPAHAERDTHSCHNDDPNATHPDTESKV